MVDVSHLFFFDLRVGEGRMVLEEQELIGRNLGAFALVPQR